LKFKDEIKEQRASLVAIHLLRFNGYNY